MTVFLDLYYLHRLRYISMIFLCTLLHNIFYSYIVDSFISLVSKKVISLWMMFSLNLYINRHFLLCILKWDQNINTWSNITCVCSNNQTTGTDNIETNLKWLTGKVLLRCTRTEKFVFLKNPIILVYGRKVIFSFYKRDTIK